MKEISYRLAEYKDCLDLAIVKKQVWNTTYRGIYSDESLDNFDVERNVNTFKKIIDNPNIKLFVTLDREKVIGFMDIGTPFKPYMDYKQELGLLYILKEYQRRGIGRLLMNVARDTVKANGYNEFIVSCNTENVNGQKFYEAMGGVIININELKNITNTEIKFKFEI
ncbi:GNAT family N-acetyltransferase [Lachnoclostridium phytofermentans]|uniref:GCN5-related N-acetyltransferase n=1 Tax=Lachnoclostridium phytofermentans (strain ATCC 700394 / DSM 18823 / ISDg) TaxID=357809 RepID=A9KR11_LACP7|nr:GNAT family N-acetyltransferase [Lachnoclostridium phytofermentans]ABX43490.1 GCN5-related N-acetyltransferase [Lachnoclostridium phytofermentans ISDg]